MEPGYHITWVDEDGHTQGTVQDYAEAAECVMYYLTDEGFKPELVTVSVTTKVE